ncbi:oxidative stress survival Svf1-like protein [Dacryopinax primogenitus]|uniref:Oxidative stress survival Svf1-like protein n=1 Tax=Dacryopinax primogenitus (strain DJM 731) TaxID=1858805 RepID=M5G8B0_DACPD|nr:oxidative stress survival Svf1-like protein [Dacryopinax primogenitus]EJU04999.1 oxidative stress survival Svf1-like protein [Dacryopinax primogenitus]
MFKNLFSSETTTNFHPVTSAYPPHSLFGPLEAKDTEWTAGGGFATETQIWYEVLENGVFMFCQIIHSSIGLWSPQVQFTCKFYDPQTNEQIWKSANVSHFLTPPPPSQGRTYDRRSSQADKFRVIHSPATATELESYKVDAQPDEGFHVSLLVERPREIEGFKFGAGARGGFSYFGEMDKPDGCVVHRFWPRTKTSGVVLVNGKAVSASGQGMFVHAIQGMRPNLVAERWNFAHFISGNDVLGGVSAIQMEFRTLESYGRKVEGREGVQGQVKVNVGCVVAGGKLAAVTGETQWVDELEGEKTGVVSRAEHRDVMVDKETGYSVPSAIDWSWSAPSLGGEGTVSAKVHSDLGGFRGLLEKVDVLAEIPYMVRKVINYATGTKPYIYQYFNPAKMEVRMPGKEAVVVEGTLFNEASFISNTSDPQVD